MGFGLAHPGHLAAPALISHFALTAPPVLQAPMFDCLSFDPFSAFDDGFGPAEVCVCRRHVAEALVVTLVVIMLDERFDLGFECSPSAPMAQN